MSVNDELVIRSTASLSSLSNSGKAIIITIIIIIIIINLVVPARVAKTLIDAAAATNNIVLVPRTARLLASAERERIHTLSTRAHVLVRIALPRSADRVVLIRPVLALRLAVAPLRQVDALAGMQARELCGVVARGRLAPARLVGAVAAVVVAVAEEGGADAAPVVALELVAVARPRLAAGRRVLVLAARAVRIAVAQPRFRNAVRRAAAAEVRGRTPTPRAVPLVRAVYTVSK